MSLRFAVNSNVLITLDIYNTLYQKQAWRGYIKKKKQVALIMLIIALQFDVSTSFNM